MKEWGSINRRLNLWFCASAFALFAFMQIGCTRTELPAIPNDLAVNSISTPQPTPEPTRPESSNETYNVVNGIRIGSTYEELKQRFGKPLSEKRAGENGCGSAKTVAGYRGITFTLDNDGESNIVVLIEIESNEWEMTPGVKVGMDITQIRTTMGRDGMYRKDEVETLGYTDVDGYLTFQFSGGKVAKITRELNLC